MKARISFWTLTLILVSGCASALTTPEPSTVTPDVMPRLDPSPTPSDSTLPLTCQVTDLNVYINEMDGFCFAYPTRFTLGDQPSDNPGVRGPDLDNSIEPTYATFGVDVTPAAANMSVREQAQAYFERTDSNMDLATWTEMQVSGEPAWSIEPIPTIGAWRMVFVEHNGSLFRLAYWPVDAEIARADIEELTQTTLGSFAFLK
jgi:hypothetical protein